MDLVLLHTLKYSLLDFPPAKRHTSRCYNLLHFILTHGWHERVLTHLSTMMAHFLIDTLIDKLVLLILHIWWYTPMHICWLKKCWCWLKSLGCIARSVCGLVRRVSGKAAMTSPSCFSTCVSQAGAPTNRATSYSYLYHVTIIAWKSKVGFAFPAPDNEGTEFIFAFGSNHMNENGTLELFITTRKAGPIEFSYTYGNKTEVSSRVSVLAVH